MVILTLYLASYFSFLEVWNDQLIMSVVAGPGEVLVALCDITKGTF